MEQVILDRALVIPPEPEARERMNAFNDLGLAPYDLWAEQTLDAKTAAEFLGVDVRWLERMRYVGAGPPFRRLSSRMIVYVRRDLLEFRDDKKFTSTAQYQHGRLVIEAEVVPQSLPLPDVEP